MPTPQPAIFRENTPHQYFLEFHLRARWQPEELRRLLGQALAARAPETSLVLAFGRDAWERLAPQEVPENFIAFHPVLGRQDRIAPGTQGDILVWLHGERHDLNVAFAMEIGRALAGIATLELELHGFTYLDSRDMTGFVDGTENPHDEEARAAARIPAGHPGAGGSFVLTQQWVHDLERFGALGQAEQESVIGRTKPDSIELDDAPPTAHVRRTDVQVDGQALKIYRRSAPFGGLRQHGLYFIAFSREIMIFAMQLDRMFGRADDGLMDRLTEFSTPVSGAYWFAPPVESLTALFGDHAG